MVVAMRRHGGMCLPTVSGLSTPLQVSTHPQLLEVHRAVLVALAGRIAGQVRELRAVDGLAHGGGGRCAPTARIRLGEVGRAVCGKRRNVHRRLSGEAIGQRAADALT